MVAMGDSVTFGVGDGAQWPDGMSGWAAHVATALGASRYLNVAHNGVRARHLMASQVPTVVAQKPDIVLFTVGGNDVMRGDFSPDEIAASLRRVFVRLDRPGTDVVTLTLDDIKIFKAFGSRIQRIMERRVAATNNAIREACVGTGVHVLDGAEVFESVGPRAWHIDRIHPSPDGHRALASRAVESLAARWRRVAEPTPARPSPSLAMRAGWLTVYGAPFVVKRSMDFVPQLAEVFRSEMRAERVRAVAETA